MSRVRCADGPYQGTHVDLAPGASGHAFGDAIAGEPRALLFRRYRLTRAPSGAAELRHVRDERRRFSDRHAMLLAIHLGVREPEHAIGPEVTLRGGPSDLDGKQRHRNVDARALAVPVEGEGLAVLWAHYRVEGHVASFVAHLSRSVAYPSASARDDAISAAIARGYRAPEGDSTLD